jgi:hypothetical protein
MKLSAGSARPRVANNGGMNSPWKGENSEV